ncbi:Protein N-terminal glutamine amidohydrolase [Rhodosporidiobolus nylandii]
MLDAPHVPYYCEETVFMLLASLQPTPPSHPPPRLFAAFISNPARHALLFQQKASRAGEEQGYYVIWDYHVVALRVEGGRVDVLDRDSRLGERVELADYVHQTFRPDLFEEDVLDPSLQSRIRLVPAADFLANFASDRSHMPVPPYPAIQGGAAKARGETHNLWTRWLDMRLPSEKGESESREEEKGFGVVLESPEELLRFTW